MVRNLETGLQKRGANMSARFVFLLGLCAWVIGFTMPVCASPTAVNLEPGATYWISNVADKCYGSNMSGLTVQLTYEYGQVTYTDTLQWTKKGSKWGVFEVNTDVNKKGKTIISLVKGGNTSTGTWTLNVAKGVTLEEIRIDGFPGKAVFDTTFNNNMGTVGSGKGKDVKIISSIPRGTTVAFTYADLVSLEGSNGAVGDLYRSLDIKFSGTKSISSLKFQVDTDTAVASPVPVPPSLVLIGSGLLLLLGVRKRRGLISSVV
jgi:hypothetical protein